MQKLQSRFSLKVQRPLPTVGLLSDGRQLTLIQTVGRQWQACPRWLWRLWLLHILNLSMSRRHAYFRSHTTVTRTTTALMRNKLRRLGQAAQHRGAGRKLLFKAAIPGERALVIWSARSVGTAVMILVPPAFSLLLQAVKSISAAPRSRLPALQAATATTSTVLPAAAAAAAAARRRAVVVRRGAA